MSHWRWLLVKHLTSPIWIFSNSLASVKQLTDQQTTLSMQKTRCSYIMRRLPSLPVYNLWHTGGRRGVSLPLGNIHLLHVKEPVLCFLLSHRCLPSWCVIVPVWLKAKQWVKRFCDTRPSRTPFDVCARHTFKPRVWVKGEAKKHFSDSNVVTWYFFICYSQFRAPHSKPGVASHLEPEGSFMVCWSNAGQTLCCTAPTL